MVRTSIIANHRRFWFPWFKSDRDKQTVYIVIFASCVMTTRQLRSGSRDECNDDLKTFMLQMEARLASKIDDVIHRLSTLEARYDDIRVEQSRLDIQQKSLITVIEKQQIALENFEIRSRKSNLILSGVPESDIVDLTSTLKSDFDKVDAICRMISQDFHCDDISECFRIGKKSNNKSRPLKIKFNNIKMRNDLLYNQKTMRENLPSSWRGSKIFANPDLPLLTRTENLRLRTRLKEEKEHALPTDNLYIRRGKLFKNSIVIDAVDIISQLF